jgi:shikimate dehydrogenase
VAITSGTRTFAVLGDPVAHSRSPLIHNAALKAADIDAVYVALRCSSDDAPGLIHGLARAGGGGNITIPHKGLAAETVEQASAAVGATNACNTFWLRRGKVYGENTDVTGFKVAVREVVADLKGARVLIVGSGGAARSVLHAVLDEGASAVTVLGRTPARGKEMAAVAGRRARRVSFLTDAGRLGSEGFDLVVNATSLGMKDTDRLPLKLSALGGLTAVFDVVYREGGTAWVQAARANGIPAADGGEMLIQQAAAAFELWFDVDAPVSAMRRAFRLG